MGSEKGNRVFAWGAQCAPLVFEAQKSLVEIGLKELISLVYRNGTTLCYFPPPPPPSKKRSKILVDKTI